MIGFPLTDDNFMLYAAQNYDNPLCFDEVEFFDDIKRFKYIKKLFKKYKDTGILRERLILNHLIIIFNLFGTIAANRMLFFKLPEFHSELKTFLVFLNYMPEKIIFGDTKTSMIYDSDIQVDATIVQALRTI